MILSSMLIMSAMFTGCATTSASTDAVPQPLQTENIQVQSDKLDQLKMCQAVEDFAYLATSFANKENVSDASPLKLNYNVEACKKIMCKNEGFGIVSFFLTDGDHIVAEEGVIVTMIIADGRWVAVNAQTMYSVTSPEYRRNLREEFDDGIQPTKSNRGVETYDL